MKLGEVVKDGRAGMRDAFHVPAVLVTCSQDLRPGDPVRFSDASGKSVVRVASWSDSYLIHAVVDPFRLGANRTIRAGELFWALLLPGLAGNLTHNFDLNVTPDVADALRCGDKGC